MAQHRGPQVLAARHHQMTVPRAMRIQLAAGGWAGYGTGWHLNASLDRGGRPRAAIGAYVHAADPGRMHRSGGF